MEKISPDSDEQKKSLMVQRRTILLAVVAGTPADSPILSRIIDEGYLSAVKMWLDDVLQHFVGKSIIEFNVDDHCFTPSQFSCHSRFCGLLAASIILHCKFTCNEERRKRIWYG